jgi:hypothetical protein
MNLILCMAGLYRRFRDAGYTVPKFLLSWEDGTILSAVLWHLRADGAFSSVLLVGNQRDSVFRPHIEAILREQGLPSDALVLIEDTGGQAETALLGAEELERRLRPSDRRVVFHNIDTILLGRDYRSIARHLDACDGYIDTFEADSPAYSYVRIGEHGLVTDIAEKRVISPHATTGLYAFSSLDDYRAAYAACRWGNGERYISSLYRSMIEAGARIHAGGSASSADTIILGTPDEYESALRPA